jgi:RNA-directed DNA polymerase
MMHGAQKSDSPIVPRKPANKAGRPVAEPVEGSGGIERNAERQSTVRTPRREAVSQAPARIREAVNRNRGEKLTALRHHVTPACLRWAYFQLRKEAAPGVEGTTWEDDADGLEGKLEDLHRRIHTGA